MKISTRILILAVCATGISLAQAGTYPDGVDPVQASYPAWNGLMLASDSQESQEQEQEEGAGEQTYEEPDCE